MILNREQKYISYYQFLRTLAENLRIKTNLVSANVIYFRSKNSAIYLRITRIFFYKRKLILSNVLYNHLWNAMPTCHNRNSFENRSFVYKLIIILKWNICALMICVKDDHLNCELFCVRPDQTANFKTKVDLIGKFFFICSLRR